MNILTIVGARPQFIKAAMVSRAVNMHNEAGRHPPIVEEIIHTGQHYDPGMSDIFFQEMGISEPVMNLQAGTGLHGEMTGRMLAQIEVEIMARRPDLVLVYGDTNSTLAGALAAAKLHIPIAHVEAGLRSYNRAMPEEISRILTDHVSTLLFCPTLGALEILKREGIDRGVHHVGDVMYDAARVFGYLAEERSGILAAHGLTSGAYTLATLHRAENTDEPERLRSTLVGLGMLARDCPVIFPLHPRTAHAVRQQGLEEHLKPLTVLPPVSFLDMVMLEKHARCILTDSGGVQKEAYFHGVPCVTLRTETEWTETVACGWNQVVGTDSQRMVDAVHQARTGKPIVDYGAGSASVAIVGILAQAD
ncbi:MAG: UDP-N-acetylglucosamine 2-epimerase (non-hydrolyzing) [Lentisphaerae bacterium]|nr:UDP-N-acetylglucosamine 2-epimerase (non-hydrolyzing) [Lentisphaerota bacterium]